MTFLRPRHNRRIALAAVALGAILAGCRAATSLAPTEAHPVARAEATGLAVRLSVAPAARQAQAVVSQVSQVWLQAASGSVVEGTASIAGPFVGGQTYTATLPTLPPGPILVLARALDSSGGDIGDATISAIIASQLVATASLNLVLDPNYSLPLAPGSLEATVSLTDGGTVSVTPVLSSPPGSVVTLAGNGTDGLVNGASGSAEFGDSFGIAVAASGDLYVSDTFNNVIRLVRNGVVSTYAGNGTAGHVDGAASSAEFDQPDGIALLPDGSLAVAEWSNKDIRIISPSGTVSTLAGSSAGLGGPEGVAYDPVTGDLVVADWGVDNAIMQVTLTGTVTTIAGSATSGWANGATSSATFDGPSGVAVDATGDLFVTDYDNNLIREIVPSGTVSTLAGNLLAGFGDGQGSAASFNKPWGIAVNSAGDVFVADEDNHCLRKIDPAGNVTTAAGSGAWTWPPDGVGLNSSFWYPVGLTIDASGNLYEIGGDAMVRKITF